jgi:uncharacterized repeat protein (TIGR02543 family)
MNMKKIGVLALSSLLLSGLLVGCGEAASSGVSSLLSGGSVGSSGDTLVSADFKVRFNAGEGKFADGSSLYEVGVMNGATVQAPADPTREGYAFSGWYQDTAYKVAFDFATAITADWTLYAKYGVSTTSSSQSSTSSSGTSSSSESSGTTSAASLTFYLDASAVSWWADASALIKAHYWYPTGKGTDTTWPGVAMTLVKSLVYSITVTGTPTGFVFVRQDPATGGSVWNQSVDAAVETGKDCFVLSTETDSQSHLKGTWGTYSA